MNSSLKHTCPVCKGHKLVMLQKPEKRVSFVTKGPEITVRIGVCSCKSCGFIFLNPRMSKSQTNDYYARQSRMPRKIINDDSPLIQLMDMQINFIQRNQPLEDGVSVLEVGCAEAYFLKRILEAKHKKLRIYGVEPSKNYLEAAIELIPSGKFYNDMLENVDFEKEKFDLIVMRHVLEHIQSPVSNLKIISSILNQNGRLYIEVPDASIPVEAVCHYFHHEHLSYFTLETLTATLARAGLRVIHSDQFTGNPRNSGFDYPVLRVIAVPGHGIPAVNYQDQSFAVWERHMRSKKIFLEEKLSPVLARIKILISQGRKLGLFGAGPHTMDLLGQVRISPAVWMVVFDNNPAKHGKRLLGIPIKIPTVERLSELDAILVSSNAFEAEIVAQLREIAPKKLEILTIYQ